MAGEEGVGKILLGLLYKPIWRLGRQGKNNFKSGSHVGNTIDHQASYLRQL